MNIKEPIELIAEFIAPYEDDLKVLMIGDKFEPGIDRVFKTSLNITRKSLPDFLAPLDISTIKPTDLFHGKNSPLLKDNICIVILDNQMSLNVISFLTNELKDDMESMLIDKYLMDVPQEKYIFDISTTDDDTLAKLCQNMDKKPGAYNYLICGEYLAIWILYNDDFHLIQDL